MVGLKTTDLNQKTSQQAMAWLFVCLPAALLTGEECVQGGWNGRREPRTKLWVLSRDSDS